MLQLLIWATSEFQDDTQWVEMQVFSPQVEEVFPD
jgi:hypothetical protein